MNVHIRLETPADHRVVEELTREAFWRLWDPNRKICDEHLLVHKLRAAPCYVPELDFVAEMDGKIVGHILYSRCKILEDGGKEHEMLTFGPLSVLPEHQNKGIGQALMNHSFERARQLGYRAVIIYGHPDYYPRVGFRRAAEFGIATPEGKNFDPFMAYPLYEGALDGIHGRCFIDPVYDQLTEEEALIFDKEFTPKERYIPTPVDVLLERLDPEAKRAIEDLHCPSLEGMTSKSERELSSLPGVNCQSLAIIRSVFREHGIRWGERK